MVILRVFCVAIVLSGVAACAMEIENKVLVPQKRWCDLFTIKEHFQLEGIIEKHMSGYEGIVVDIRALAKESNTWKEILDTEYHTEHLLRAIDRRSKQINSKDNFDMFLRCEAQFLHLELAAVVLGTRGAIAFGKKYIQMPEAKQRVVNFLFEIVHYGHQREQDINRLAWEDEDLDVVRAALDMGIEVGSGLLRTAARANKPKIVELLLNRSVVDIETKKIVSARALLSASEYGGEVVMDLLLACGPDLNVIDNSGRTSLILAAMSGRAKIVAKLLVAGATEWLQDVHEKTALYYAETYLSDASTEADRQAMWYVPVHHTWRGTKKDYETTIDLLKKAGAK